MGASPSREGDSRERGHADGAALVDRQERRERYRHDRHERDRVDQRQRWHTRDDKRLDEEWLAKKRARCEELALAALSAETLDSDYDYDEDEDEFAEPHVDEPTVVESVPSAVSSSERSDGDVYCKNQPRSDRSRTIRVSDEHEKRSDRVHTRTRGQLEGGRHNDGHRTERVRDRSHAERERSPSRRKRPQLDRNDSGDDEMRLDQEWLAEKRARRGKLALVSSGPGTLEITPIDSKVAEPESEPSDDAETHSCPGSPTYGSARAQCFDVSKDDERIELDHNQNYRKRSRKEWSHSSGSARKDSDRKRSASRSSHSENRVRRHGVELDERDKWSNGGGRGAPVADADWKRNSLTGGCNFRAHPHDRDPPEWFSSMRDRDRRRRERKNKRRSRSRDANNNERK